MSSTDSIDIYSDPKILVKKLPSDPDVPTEIRIQLESEAMNCSVANAIRRCILMYIPVYGFHRSQIYIDNEKSRHMYNNDMIFNQIECLPLLDIPNNFDLENPEIFLPNNVMRDIFSNQIQKKNISYIKNNISTKSSSNTNKKLAQIELILNVKNTTDKYKYVTTHDATLNIDNKPSKTYLQHDPIAIIVLKPGEEIALRAEANLGTSMMNATYEATTNVVSKEIIPDKKYEIMYETLEQLSSIEIFHKACIILIHKLENLISYLKTKFPTEPTDLDIIKIKLYGEEHTLGYAIATSLQKCEFIKEAGYNIPHPQIDVTDITYVLKPKAKIGKIEVLIETISYLIRLFKNIEHSVSKLS